MRIGVPKEIKSQEFKVSCAVAAASHPNHLPHLAADLAQAKGLVRSGATCIAYETIVGPRGGLPLLAPMSQVAGRMAVDVGAAALLRPSGGRGMLLGGAPGVAPAKVVVLGGGVAGKHAAEIAIGHRSDVTLFEISAPRLEELDDQFGGRLKTVFSTPDAIRAAVIDADLVTGCVLIPGAAAPKLVTREDIARMKTGAVMVDLAIDQGGCLETSRPTTHAEPTFVIDGVVHHCVANMPGAAPLTSTYALSAATAPYLLDLANKGMSQAFADDPGFSQDLKVEAGEIIQPQVRGALSARSSSEYGDRQHAHH